MHENDASGNLNSSFHVGADILNLLFLDDTFIFFHVYYKLRFDKTTYFSLSLFLLQEWVIVY